MRTLIVASGILALTGSAGAMAGHRVASQDPLGSPAEAGLVVVEVRFERSKAHKLFGWGADNVRGYLVWLGDEPRVFEGKESKDLIIFSGLQPGPYRLDGITATLRTGNLSRPLEARMPADDARFSVDVKAGTAAYLGKVTIVDQDRMFRIGRPPPPKTSIEHDAALAAEAWKRFLAAHAKTAWAARVREQLAGTATAASETPAAASPLERVEALVREADEAEQNGTVRNFLERRKAALVSAESDLASHVASHPEDARSMLMGVRLAWLRESTTPVRLDLVAGHQDVAAPDANFVALATTTDRVIALQPDNAAAHFWKARISAVELPAVKDGVLVKIARDLPEAIVSARRAVELEPSSVLYRDALATFLVMDDKPAEAVETLRDVKYPNGAPHPMVAILAAWQALPLPKNAQEQRLLARGLTEMQVEQGRISSYPVLRIRMYTVPIRASKVEAFYKARWNTFKLFEKEKQRDGETRTALFGQFLGWNNGALEPATSERQVDAAAERLATGDGFLMTVTEVINLPPEKRAKVAGVASDTFCHLTFVNTVSMTR